MESGEAAWDDTPTCPTTKWSRSKSSAGRQRCVSVALEIVCGAAEVCVVIGYDEIVKEVETEDGDEGYLHHNPSILTTVGPKVLYCLVHLF